MITIYWHCLETTASDEDEKFVAGALDQLAQHLKAEPIKLSISIKRLGNQSNLAKKIAKELDQLNDERDAFSKCEGAIVSAFYIGGLIGTKLLVYCSPNSKIALAAQKNVPHAEWGATCESFAAVYSLNNKSAIFHEALHLLGANDCYDLSKSDCGPNCECPNCIMQFEATRANVRNWPFLCDANIQRMQKRIREWK